MESLDIVEKAIKVEWLTKKGWITYSIALFFLSIPIIKSFQIINIPLNQGLIKGFLFLPQVLHTILWFGFRNYFNDPLLLTIAFGINVDDKSLDYYRQIKRKFKDQIVNFNLTNEIKVKELPSDINFSNQAAAEKYIERKGMRLLIWGDTIQGNTNGAPFSNFNIKISYLHGIDSEKNKSRLIKDIAEGVQRVAWGIHHPNSFRHLLVVTGNILEISLYTLGVCLARVPDFQYCLNSVKILEQLQILLRQRKQDANFPNLQIVKKRTESILCENYINLAIYYGQANLEQAINYLNKAITMDDKNFIAHLNISVFYWEIGNKDLAKYHTKRAQTIKKGNSLPHLNQAFFSLHENDYKNAIRHYKKVCFLGETNVVEVVIFLEKEFEKNSKKLGILFALGWVNFYHGDKSMGIKQFKEFLNLTKGDYTYNPLTREVQHILNIH